MDHQTTLPKVTTAILTAHTDEVWNVEWSHDGVFLASVGKDRCAIIWRIGKETEPSAWNYTPELILRDHPYAVFCLAWSLDDSILLTSSDSFIKLWDTKSGVCIRDLEAHSETVTALEWLPDGSGFISGGLDRKMIIWDAEGKQRDTWGITSIRVTDLTVTPDNTRVIVVGMQPLPPSQSTATTDLTQHGHGVDTPSVCENGTRSIKTHMLIYNLATKQIELSVPLEGDSTCVNVSQDSQYALINHAPDTIHLWDINLGQLVRKFTGQHQGRHAIRSCFGGIDGKLVVSGSEDGKVYVWHRETGALLEVLSGHGEGSVNSVTWNPQSNSERVFASCSDDNTVRMWGYTSTTTVTGPPP